jgi:hypothetical protein
MGKWGGLDHVEALFWQRMSIRLCIIRVKPKGETGDAAVETGLDFELRASIFQNPICGMAAFQIVRDDEC